MRNLTAVASVLYLPVQGEQALIMGLTHTHLENTHPTAEMS